VPLRATRSKPESTDFLFFWGKSQVEPVQDQRVAQPGKNKIDLLRVARGGSGAKAHPLAARPTRFLMREHSKQETHPGGWVSFD